MNAGLEDEREGFLTALGNLQRSYPDVATYVHKVTLTAPSTATVVIKPCMVPRNAVCGFDKKDKSKRYPTRQLAGVLWDKIKDHSCLKPGCPRVGENLKRKREG
jgi:hypothetical protein